jgi:predicted membrane protein
MDELRKIIISLVSISVAIWLSVLAMVHGWGLEPQSYWWIIGVGFGAQVLLRITERIVKS